MAQMTLLNVKVPTDAHLEIARIESLSNLTKSAVVRAALRIGLQELEGVNSYLGIDKLTRTIVNSEREIKEGK